MYVVSQLSAADLPCSPSPHFDPWLKTFWSEQAPAGSNSLTIALVSLFCLTAVTATALLVLSLYRQQQRARGRDRYRLAGRMVGVTTQWGVGYLNQEFKQDEAEMTEIRSIQPWPPATGHS